MEEKKKTTEEEYCFLQEAVREPQREKGFCPAKKLVYVIVLACVFGVVASVVFWKVQDVLSERDAQVYRENLLNNSDNVQEEQNNSVGKSDADMIEAYEDYWKRITQIGVNCNKSVVSVRKIHTESWYQKSKQDDMVQSGLLFKRKGGMLYILTQLSSITGKKVLEVEFVDGKKASAKLVEEDNNIGIAVLGVNVDGVSKSTMKEIVVTDFTQYASELSLKLSDRILLFGCPNGMMNSVMLGNIVNADISVQATDKNFSVFATDIAYTKGGNGFAMNIEGKIIGMITEQYKDITGETNWAFVSSADIAVMAQAIVDRKRNVYLGIHGKDAGDREGVYVTEVQLKSPAYHGGIRVADRIYSIDGNKIKTMNDLSLCLSTHQQGDRLTLRLCREGGGSEKHKAVKITLD